MSKILIVGSGLFGSVLARELTDSGYDCHVIERRNHTGGNCHTENMYGINVHKYGAHIFHTSKKRVWDYLLKHTTVNQFSLRMKSRYANKVYSLPINLMTMNQMWGIMTPEEARIKIGEVTKEYKKDIYNNAEEWALGNVGEDLYNTLYKGYLEKQWRKDPKDIPTEIMARQVVRLDYNDNYYYDPYQGMPNYTKFFESLLDGIKVDLGVDFLADREYFDSKYDKIIYSGAIDEFYEYIYGTLEYRSLRFENEIIQTNDYQGTAVMAYPEKKYDFTRIIEHKHFEFGTQDVTVITKEYPEDWNIGSQAYYPFNNPKNQEIYDKYATIDIGNKYIFGGRLGSYKYLNMDDTIEKALCLVDEFKNL